MDREISTTPVISKATNNIDFSIRLQLMVLNLIIKKVYFCNVDAYIEYFLVWTTGKATIQNHKTKLEIIKVVEG